MRVEFNANVGVSAKDFEAVAKRCIQPARGELNRLLDTATEIR